ncbi:malectin, transcript variant X1 [Ictidomys tridecemlineatus]|nr:malectin, transcript variant X1 [Ictidomys tridecemlineatus]
MLGPRVVEGAAGALLRLLLLMLLPSLREPRLGVAGVVGAGLPESVIWAVNAGGEAHVDVHGIHFRKDPLEGRVGRASDYGMKLPILRSNPEDQILYQTERYNEETFGYEVPIKEEGDYVLVLKFAEVYFAQSQQKVFDVRLNGHVVVKDLDIFDRVGHSTAHDEIIPMSIRKGKLSVQGEVSTFTGKLYIEFVKVMPHSVSWLRNGSEEWVRITLAAVWIDHSSPFPRGIMTIPKSVHSTSWLEQWMMYQSYSLIQDWRRKKRKKKKKNMMKGLISKDRPIRTGCSLALAHPTPMPQTTAASCFPSWWPLESSFQPSSASAGCENK